MAVLALLVPDGWGNGLGAAHGILLRIAVIGTALLGAAFATRQRKQKRRHRK
jgi:hypothetical protein